MKPSASHTVPIRGLAYHVRSWGDPGAPKLFMLHGWMDVGASFQFLVDALRRDWQVIAPDWRGFGLSEWCADGYWFADYLADLDALLDRFAPDEPTRLVGHSLGGNVVMLYAGVRPQRVARVVSLEGFGIPAESPDVAPAKMTKWLDALRNPPSFRPYKNLAAVADQLQRNNPRLSRDKAEFLAAHWARTQPDGSARLSSDPRHKLPFPTVYRMKEVVATWQQITAPVLWVAATESFIPTWLGAHPEGEAAADSLEGIRARLKQVPHGELLTVDQAGHMLHLDRPEAVAAAIEPFLGS
ncbi:MAG TPA: alpha/beta hydrolase [Casimicrobiaceae bacterium]|jgi:pimeloyl-ACP methyl ester carboxylesterase|nr:alpha/beta hydrolase [Casimicrobiaceae bacterium]